MATLKAGCFLVLLPQKKIGIVFREKHKDFSFPKGHLEKGETLQECAVRETAEETKRSCHIVVEQPFINNYTTSKGEECSCYMYIAIDDGPSDNKSEDTHTFLWVDFENVEDKVSSENLKKIWREVKDVIKNL